MNDVWLNYIYFIKEKQKEDKKVCFSSNDIVEVFFIMMIISEIGGN